jgi:hypothetical protein
MDQSSLEPILAYLRENSGRYDSATLRESLLRAGYPPDEIDREIPWLPTPKSPAPLRPTSPPTFGVFLLKFVFVPLAVAGGVILLWLGFCSGFFG